MSKKMTLADLRNEADNRFGDLDIDGVVFRSILRLGDKARKTASGMMKEIGALQGTDDAVASENLDVLSKQMRDLLALVATDRAAAVELLKQMDDAEVATLLGVWNETTQAGEASSSSS